MRAGEREQLLLVMQPSNRALFLRRLFQRLWLLRRRVRRLRPLLSDQERRRPFFGHRQLQLRLVRVALAVRPRRSS